MRNMLTANFGIVGEGSKVRPKTQQVIRLAQISLFFLTVLFLYGVRITLHDGFILLFRSKIDSFFPLPIFSKKNVSSLSVAANVIDLVGLNSVFIQKKAKAKSEQRGKLIFATFQFLTRYSFHRLQIKNLQNKSWKNSRENIIRQVYL